MKNKTEHTPTPWRTLADGYIGADETGKKIGRVVVAEICSGNIADKEFIVLIQKGE